MTTPARSSWASARSSRQRHAAACAESGRRRRLRRLRGWCRTLDASWVIHWVRGPRTARLPRSPRKSAACGDPAMLLPQAGFCRSRCSGACTPGTRPRGRSASCRIIESAGRGAWHEAASAAGVQLIDPRGRPGRDHAAIGSCRVLLSEAMLVPSWPTRCACHGRAPAAGAGFITRSGMTGPQRWISESNSRASPLPR